ncbi:glycoside hydrolase family 2 protein [Chitinophaga nivalis]|uniref:Glycoside hydrolase family 2 n=1 Tax=Chitinophaga nivalis TaxID=2991709 RepID=A0ABT3IGI0_9BACT|nr:sugar-binding domain-containing protein [Chitinophaga nivalis]MCW3467248.1 glycoside hydrolase family 2 [Chitinophaga nivalis]MCW3483060.1 glycoside hydrolase family 2 [Chitinophaga nivalis]
MQKGKQLLLVLAVLIWSNQSKAQSGWQIQPVTIQTRWAKEVSPSNALPAYPRPQMVRSKWENLNGLWEYAVTTKDKSRPDNYEGKILVPYPIESALSGVKKSLLPTQLLWYKKNIPKPTLKKGERLLLHFGAVDYQATVYLNGKTLGEHSGGYQHFSFDITDLIRNGKNELVVKVFDPSEQGNNPHGKQVLRPQGIMYTASSGIWQTVWLETVPDVYISGIYLTPDVDKSQLQLTINTNTKESGYTIQATARSNGSIVSSNTLLPNQSNNLPVPSPQLWSPETPFLYDLDIALLYQGKVVDSIKSYFGMRKVEIKKDTDGKEKIFLNNQYTFNLGVLDQGFWPEGLYTAPTDEALMFDISAIKSMGFNTIRKHVKLEPDRWYYHCDKAGILVWQDMPTCADTSKAARQIFEAENKENLLQLHNYPSIITWVLFNEGWMRYDQKRLAKWIKETDPSRIVNAHSGENYDKITEAEEKWRDGDLTDTHEYPGPGMPPYLPNKAMVIGEWGGVGVSIWQHQWKGYDSWGYIKIPTLQFPSKYKMMTKLLKVYKEDGGLSGAIYTEPFDVETEENGFITYDREIIKIPIDTLRMINRMITAATSPIDLSFHCTTADTADHFKKYERIQNDARKSILTYQGAANWPKMINTVDEYIKICAPIVLPAELNMYSWAIFQNCDDPASLNAAVEWIKFGLLREPGDKNSIDTYANLLYKLRRKSEAIKLEEEALAIAVAINNQKAIDIYEDTLNKMKKGEKTWPE